MEADQQADWDESDSQIFIRYGRYFVPDRATQIETVVALVPPPAAGQFHILDLGAGAGLLSAALLERFPTAVVHAYDRSSEMRRWAADKLASYGERFQTEAFDLAEKEWRRTEWPVQAIVSSLAIHHLDDEQKRELYADFYRMLAPGGRVIIADVVQPTDEAGAELAAKQWDEAVRRATEADGNQEALSLFLEDGWNIYRYPDPMDRPSPLFAQLQWLAAAGFSHVDVHWMEAGHAIFSGSKEEL